MYRGIPGQYPRGLSPAGLGGAAWDACRDETPVPGTCNGCQTALSGSEPKGMYPAKRVSSVSVDAMGRDSGAGCARPGSCQVVGRCHAGSFRYTRLVQGSASRGIKWSEIKRNIPCLATRTLRTSSSSVVQADDFFVAKKSFEKAVSRVLLFIYGESRVKNM